MSDRQSLLRFVNLAQPRLGAEVLCASDEFFAEKEGLLNPETPVFIDGKFTDRGKWMDGWESRRRRTPGHDYCIMRICRGKIYGVDIDTSHFTGNYPQHASVDACDSSTDPDDSTEWHEIVPKSSLQGDSSNVFFVESTQKWSHLRLNIYPDGGVARFRVYGEVHKDWASITDEEVIDLAAMENGGVAVACSDMHFGSMWNLLSPRRAINMGDGWETKRRRGEGYDWAIIQLGHPGVIKQLEVDTLHFKGNYPAQCAVRGAFAPGATEEFLSENSNHWKTLLPESKTEANKNHVFKNNINDIGVLTHVKLDMYPDGGIGRLRVFGTKSESFFRTLVAEPLNADSFKRYGDVIDIVEHPSRVINQGYADRYENLAKLDVTDGGAPALSIFVARPVQLPIYVTHMERHPNASQAFIPKSNGRFMIVVSEPADEFDPNGLKLFVTNGKQGVNYRRGVWHHFLLAIGQEQEFIVIDRSDPDENTNEIELGSPYPIIDEFALTGLI